jgi:hypothetical protein
VNEIPSQVEIKGEVMALEIKTLASGRVMVRVPYWRKQRRCSVKFYLDPACLSWQLIDPVALLLRMRAEEAKRDLERMKQGIEGGSTT